MSIDKIARAIDMARGLSWFDDYTRWATAWLDGSDRSMESAHLAVARVRQWVGFGGESWAARCCLNAAAAAEELARGHHEHASSSASAAIRHAGFVKNPPPPEPARSPGEPELIFDDWNYDSNGAQRGRSYDPREG